MNYEIKVEVGQQLLSRLIPRPNLKLLDTTLFPAGLKNNDIIEINGSLSCGKTALMIYLIKNAILLDKYNNIKIGGLNVGIILIDLDIKFCVTQLINSMKSVIKNIKFAHVISDEDEECIIKRSLDNMIHMKCFDSKQLYCSVKALRTLVTQNSNIAILFVDNIAANYYLDIEPNGIRKMDLYKLKIIQMFQKYILDFKITLIYTKPDCFISRKPNIRNPANYKINMEKNKNNLVFTVSVCYGNDFNEPYVCKFKMNADGLSWL